MRDAPEPTPEAMRLAAVVCEHRAEDLEAEAEAANRRWGGGALSRRDADRCRAVAAWLRARAGQPRDG